MSGRRSFSPSDRSPCLYFLPQTFFRSTSWPFGAVSQLFRMLYEPARSSRAFRTPSRVLFVALNFRFRFWFGLLSIHARSRAKRKKGFLLTSTITSPKKLLRKTLSPPPDRLFLMFSKLGRVFLRFWPLAGFRTGPTSGETQFYFHDSV